MTCPRHNHCAFTGLEPDRCPSCHTTQQAVERCSALCCRQSAWEHMKAHERADATAARNLAKWHARRDARGRRQDGLQGTNHPSQVSGP